MEPVFYYLLLINACSFLLMLADKKNAIKNRCRIPERTLLSIAALGGSIGAMIGMRIFRHKTKHPKFSIGLPCLAAVHIVLCVLFLT